MHQLNYSWSYSQGKQLNHIVITYSDCLISYIILSSFPNMALKMRDRESEREGGRDQ